MPTGACGIDCGVCRLHLLGTCSVCGPGGSLEASEKMAAQVRILGAPCPILACAVRSHVAYCVRDCERFPCDAFRAGPYPFSEGFLRMQERRRGEGPAARTPSGDRVKVPITYWEDLERRDMDRLCAVALVKRSPPKGILLPFLKEILLVDGEDRCVKRQARGHWERIDDALLELLCLVYLLNVGPETLEQQIVSPAELKTGHFFRGPHILKTEPVLNRYGNDPEGFKRAAERLNGEPLALADVAYKFIAFPKVPLYYLLWKGDEEFQPVLSILFDRSIDSHLAADAIWGLVNLVSGRLLDPIPHDHKRQLSA